MSTFLKKYGFAFCAILALSFYAFSISTNLEEAPRSSSLVVGLQSGYPPFEYIDTNGKIVGFDLDMAQHIADKLGKKLVIKDMDFEGTILSLKQGKIDLILSGMNITPSRLKEIDMVGYHGEAVTSLSLIFWEKIPSGVQSLEDLANVSNAYISVESGSVSEQFMHHFPNVKVKSFQGALNPLLDVKYGKSVANLVEPDVAHYLKSKYPEIKVLSVPLSQEDYILGFGIGIKKGNQDLVKQVQSIVAELKEKGELQKLEKQWFKKEAG